MLIKKELKLLVETFSEDRFVNDFEISSRSETRLFESEVFVTNSEKIATSS